MGLKSQCQEIKSAQIDLQIERNLTQNPSRTFSVETDTPIHMKMQKVNIRQNSSDQQES